MGGRYTIRRLLARGGVGLVYLAQQRDPDREVVVKVLAPNWIDNTEAVARFEREGQRLGAVQHANIVSLYECGHENGVAFLAMEYLVGELLGDYLARKGGRLSVEEFVPIAAQILKGLGYAHSRGLMHRDIKPSNIMLCVRKGRANVVKILDFGMAKLIAGEQDITSEQIVGTANFLSPEQIKGEAVDARVDVYSLGVLFYGLLGGRMPFDADNNAAILYRHVNDPPRPLAEVLPPGHDVPAGLIELIMQCLAKDPDERPADADAMVEALIDCVQASMFHLPLADSATGAVISSSSLTGVPNPDALQSEVSNANLSRAASQGSSVATSLATGQPATQRGLRPTTHRGLRPPTNNRLRPPSVPARAASAHVAGPDPVSTIITLEAASVASPRGNWGLVIGATAALLAGGLLAAVYVLGGPGEQPPAPTVAGIAAAASASDRARASEVLDQVDADILSGEFDTARGKLDAASRELDANPELKARAARQRDRIAVATTFAAAQRLEKEGKNAAALGAYQDILAIDPGHVDARAAVARLRETPASKPGTTPVSTSPASKPTGKRGPGKPGKPGEPASVETGVEPELPPEPEKPAEEDPFLPVAKKDDGGVFLPVGQPAGGTK
ncbi:serine/threonine-protein kinase [Nannocystis sp.]|uniref:serine/threonine-protein kinase n=1 Tax=Nannocystis sp. TaxID=1962667 RepID=UPI0025D22197|nr:serine/threonine-protein kinase [Nannocystis sp.]MBK7826745.1 protein kinase [Nannocystis sp.]